MKLIDRLMELNGQNEEAAYNDCPLNYSKDVIPLETFVPDCDNCEVCLEQELKNNSFEVKIMDGESVTWTREQVLYTLLEWESVFSVHQVLAEIDNGMIYDRDGMTIKKVGD